MDVTLIVPHDEGYGDIANARVLPGKLTLEQLNELTEEPAYKRRAVLAHYNTAGDLIGLSVSFNNCADVEPTTVDDRDDYGRHVGQIYSGDHQGTGHLSYEARYTTLEDPPGVGLYLLASIWTEPCRGSILYSCRLTSNEAAEVEKAIAWLREHAGQDWGGALPSWELIYETDLTGKADLTGLGDVLGYLKLNSRYEEDPSFYGPERYPLFEISADQVSYATLESTSKCPGVLAKSPDGEHCYDEYDRCVYCGERGA